MMQGTGAGADMGGDGFASEGNSNNNNNNNNNNNKGQRAYEGEGECNGWVGAREHRHEREGSRADTEVGHEAPRRRETEAEYTGEKMAESIDSTRTSHNMREAMTGPREEVRGPQRDRESTFEGSGWILAPSRPLRGDMADSKTESEVMEHEEWVDGVWALSASKRHADHEDEYKKHADYKDEYEGEQDCYGYHSRTQRDATAAEPRRADAREQGCGARGSPPLRARELRNLQQNERADEGKKTLQKVTPLRSLPL